MAQNRNVRQKWKQVDKHEIKKCNVLRKNLLTINLVDFLWEVVLILTTTKLAK